MEGDGEKVMDTNTGGSPGYQSQSQQLSEEVIGHCTPTGCRPKDIPYHTISVYYCISLTYYAQLSCWGGSHLFEIVLHSFLLFTCKDLLPIVQSWSFGYSVYALCYSPIQELCVRWPLSLELSSAVSAHESSSAVETPQDFLTRQSCNYLQALTPFKSAAHL